MVSDSLADYTNEKLENKRYLKIATQKKTDNFPSMNEIFFNFENVKMIKEFVAKPTFNFQGYFSTFHSFI